MAQVNYIEIAEKFEGPMKRALIEAIKTLRTQFSLTQIEATLVAGGPEALLALYQEMAMVFDSAIGDIIDDAIKAGGAAAVTAIPAAGILIENFRFDLINPVTIDFIRNYKLNLIQKVSQNTIEAIRQSVAQDLIDGVNPRQTAKNFRDNLGLTPKQEQAVRNYRKSLETLDRDALNRNLRDKRFDRTVLRAIDKDTPLSEEQIDKFVNRYRQRYINYRAETIARTESLRAVNVGNEAAIQQLIQNGGVDLDIVRKHWVFTRDKRTRNGHRRIPKMNPDGVRLDEQFQTPLGPLRFPGDPNGTAENTIQCRCRLRYTIIDEEGI